MLVCGEDLGMVPACVQGVLDALSILGLRIQRMPKDDKLQFDNPAHYPYLSVATPSVHDTSTLRCAPPASAVNRYCPDLAAPFRGINPVPART